SAAVQADEDAIAQRGPAISTVNQESRRALRAQTLASSQRVNKRIEAEKQRASSSRRSAIMGVGIGASLVAPIAVVVVVVMWMYVARPTKAPAKPGRFLRPTAAVLAVGAVVAGAIIVNGYDAQDVPQLETSVWVTRSDGMYARVN